MTVDRDKFLSTGDGKHKSGKERRPKWRQGESEERIERGYFATAACATCIIIFITRSTRRNVKKLWGMDLARQRKTRRAQGYRGGIKREPGMLMRRTIVLISSFPHDKKAQVMNNGKCRISLKMGRQTLRRVLYSLCGGNRVIRSVRNSFSFAAEFRKSIAERCWKSKEYCHSFSLAIKKKKEKRKYLLQSDK